MLGTTKFNIQLLFLCIFVCNATSSSNFFVKLFNASLNALSGLSSSTEVDDDANEDSSDCASYSHNNDAEELRKMLQSQGAGNSINEQARAKRNYLLNTANSIVNRCISKKCKKIDDLDYKSLAVENAKHNDIFKGDCINLNYVQDINTIISRIRTPEEKRKRRVLNSPAPISRDSIAKVFQELHEKLVFSQPCEKKFFTKNLTILWNSLELSFAKHKLNNDEPNIIKAGYVQETTRLNYDCSFLLYLEILCVFMTSQLVHEENEIGVFQGAHSFLLLSAIRMLIPSFKVEENSSSFEYSLSVMPFESQDNWKKYADYFFTSCIYLRYYLYLDYKEAMNSVNVTGKVQDPFILYFVCTTTFDMLETFINLSLNYNNIVNDKEINFYTINQDKIEEIELGTDRVVLDDWVRQKNPVIKFEANVSTDVVLFKLFRSLINIQKLPINFVMENIY